MVHAVAALTHEKHTRHPGGSIRSVRHTLLHLIAGEWGWLASENRCGVKRAST